MTYNFVAKSVGCLQWTQKLGHCFQCIPDSDHAWISYVRFEKRLSVGVADSGPVSV